MEDITASASQNVLVIIELGGTELRQNLPEPSGLAPFDGMVQTFPNIITLLIRVMPNNVRTDLGVSPDTTHKRSDSRIGARA